MHRTDGWCQLALTKLGDTELLVGSLHNPAFAFDDEQTHELDLRGIKLEKNPKLWFVDILTHFLKEELPRPLLFGGDLNASRLLDDLYGDRGNNELFDRVAKQGFVSVHRLFNQSDQQTFFKKRGHPHQLDYLYADPTIAARTKSCNVVSYQQCKRFSDHVPLLAEL